MTAFLTWLPDVLRDAGVKVEILSGAERRSSRHDGLAVRGIVWHHTATGPNWTDANVAKLLRDGRPDLRGPLSQVGIKRDGTWVIVALGRANHNGYGEWGNDSLGLEFYNSGVGEKWPEPQVRSGVVGTAAVLAYLGKSIHVVKGHKETDPRRKIDPAGLDMATIRRQIDAEIRRKPTPQEDDIVPELEIIKAFDRYLGKDEWGRLPSDHELQLHAWYAAVNGIANAVLNIARSQEAKDRRGA